MDKPVFRAKKEQPPKMPPKGGTNLYDQTHVNEAAKGNLKSGEAAAQAVENAEGEE